MYKQRILIVEDEAVVSLDIEEGLKAAGCEVVDVVESGEAAICAAREKKPNLVLMDIVLRGSMDGIQAAAVIRDELNLPVVYLTAHADEATLRRARVTTPYGYLLKPFDEEELRPAVEMALARFEQETKAIKASEGSIANNGEVNLSAFNWKRANSGFPSHPNPNCDLREFFNSSAPFSGLPKAQRRQLEEASIMRKLEGGADVVHEGDRSANAFLVAYGRVVIVKSSASGKELIVDIIPPGDILPLAAALEELPFPFTAKTQVDSHIVFLPVSAFRRVLEQYPEMYREISSQLASRLRESFDMARRLAHDRVEVRLAATLVGLHHRLGLRGEPAEEYVLEVTRKELADLTGMSPETASRVAKSLEKRGLIDLHQAGLVIVNQPEALEELAMG